MQKAGFLTTQLNFVTDFKSENKTVSKEHRCNRCERIFKNESAFCVLLFDINDVFDVRFDKTRYFNIHVAY